MRAVHIAIVTETFPPDVNGVAMTLARWVGGLIDRGCTITLVRPRPGTDVDEDDGLPFRVEDEDLLRIVHVRGLPIPRYPALRFGLPAGRRLQHLWQAKRPDILYIATEGPLGRSALGAAGRMGIPALSGFHTNFHAYSRHYGFGFLQKLILGYLRRFHNRSAGTLVPTPALASELHGLGFDNVSVLSRGVDSRLFNPAKRSRVLRRQWGAGDDDTVALYVGRLAPEKNLPLAVEAWRAMRERAAGTRLVLVGDGPMREILARQAPDIHFCGIKTGNALAEIYASCDVFLFPSETETFGNVILESMASSLVPVACDYAAAHMHIIDKCSGRLTPLGDSAAFISAAAELAGEKALLTRLGRAARNHAECYDWSVIVDQLIDCLERFSADSPECATAT